MELKKINRMGMDLDERNHKSCTATIGLGEDWATVYSITSVEKRKGHATELLTEMKLFYEKQNKDFASSVALSNEMKSLLQKLEIKEYT